ncbi:hypothetical protein HAX54_035274 [Datura stramonium]|uniref:Uncharacterized protein n=1 Tax=Datura stramonium TaxID=4076 RepID=A0ABS8RLX1_DATST|nr:hypothetical protein [Datura stramonium]
MDAQNHVEVTIPKENQAPEEDFDYSQRAQWLRAAVLGANDGLVSIASLMMGVGAVQENIKTMILTGFAGLFAGACSMAIGEFVSVYSQLDIERAQMKRDRATGAQNREHQQDEEGNKEQLPNPFQAAVASSIAFSLGAIVPILAAAFIANHKVRLAVIVAAVSLALVAFGGIGAFLGRSPMVKSCARVLIGGWMAMAITFGLTKLICSTGLEMQRVTTFNHVRTGTLLLLHFQENSTYLNSQIAEMVYRPTTNICLIEEREQKHCEDGAFQITINKDHDDKKQVLEEDFDYSQRAQWVRAAVLGANDGLVSIASLMMGVGAVQENVKTMILTGFAGLIAGACSMAIGEFVSVYSQLDIERAQMKRDKTTRGQDQEHEEGNKEQLPNPFQAAVASAIAFSLGAIVPILAAAFIANHKVRLAVIVAAVSLALLAFGGIGAFLGRSPMSKSCARVLIGGWMAMAITFGLTKLIGSTTGMEL